MRKTKFFSAVRAESVIKVATVGTEVPIPSRGVLLFGTHPSVRAESVMKVATVGTEVPIPRYFVGTHALA
ncbi:hypothetical protein MLC52_10585 [Sulfurimonas sp. NW15]|uniref:hypothetical protein n=1 Tax=Sulfurimonas sp. NW15 TaxID=2922729 RepID=UPI003DA8E9E3